MAAGPNPCQEFFELHARNTNKAEQLQLTGQAVQWEALSASAHSPGPVQADEHVLRLVINPVHVDSEDGSIKPSLMSDVKDKGGSVHRLNHISREDAISLGRAHAEAKNAAVASGSPPRSIYGTVKLSVHEVRSLLIATKSRAFGVFDTAKQADPSHADIFQIVAGNGREARSARIQLWELANKGFQPG